MEGESVIALGWGLNLITTGCLAIGLRNEKANDLFGMSLLSILLGLIPYVSFTVLSFFGLIAAFQAWPKQSKTIFSACMFAACLVTGVLLIAHSLFL